MAEYTGGEAKSVTLPYREGDSAKSTTLPYRGGRRGEMHHVTLARRWMEKGIQVKQGHSKTAYLAGKGWLPFWYGSGFSRRLLHKRERTRWKKERRNHS